MNKQVLFIFAFSLLALITLFTAPGYNVTHASSLPLYVAMGDSAAAGAGLNPNPVNSCNQSSLAYPTLLANAYHLNLVNVTCAGATVPAGITGPQGPYAPQLQQLFAAGDPAYVTLTIGGNDINWYNAIVLCLQTHCTPSTLPPTVVASESTLLTNLQGVYQQISQHYGSQAPQVYETSYYNLVNPNYNCSDLSGANPVLLASSAATIEASLANTIQEAMQPYSFAHYVSVSFSGHELCTPDPWIQGLSDPAPYHPTAQGQQAFAQAVYSAYQASVAASNAK